MRTYTRYTREILNEAAYGCDSFAQLARALGKAAVGSTITQLQARCKKLGVDTSHFTSQAWRKGRVAPNRKTTTDILTLNDPLSSRVERKYLYRALIDIGREYKCEVCDQLPVWNNRPLTLQIDHIDGCHYNNVESNLRFVCPNCHTQTDTWGYRPQK